jgi:hypothetical protein
VGPIVLSLADVSDVLSASFVAPLVGFLGGFGTAILAEPLRQRLFRARLKLEFGQSSNFITPAFFEETKHKGRYIRIRVMNTKQHLARSCRAFLINIEKQNEKGVFEQTQYYDSQQLKWSAIPQAPFSEIDIPYGVNRYIDLLLTESATNTFRLCIEHFSFWLSVSPGFEESRGAEKLLRQTGTFRFTILVSGDGIEPQVVRMVFLWRGEWDKFSIHKE